LYFGGVGPGHDQNDEILILKTLEFIKTAGEPAVPVDRQWMVVIEISGLDTFLRGTGPEGRKDNSSFHGCSSLKRFARSLVLLNDLPEKSTKQFIEPARLL
jgi:hypothetical protein